MRSVSFRVDRKKLASWELSATNCVKETNELKLERFGEIRIVLEKIVNYFVYRKIFNDYPIILLKSLGVEKIQFIEN